MNSNTQNAIFTVVLLEHDVIFGLEKWREYCRKLEFINKITFSPRRLGQIPEELKLTS